MANAMHKVGPVPALDPLQVVSAQALAQIWNRQLHMPSSPALTCRSKDALRSQFVDDLEPLGYTRQIRPLTHDVMSQAMQRTYSVAHLGQQTGRLHELSHPHREILDG